MAFRIPVAPPLPVRATAPPSYIVRGDPISTCKGFWCERWVELENPTVSPLKISDRRVGPPLCARLDLAASESECRGGGASASRWWEAVDRPLRSQHCRCARFPMLSIDTSGARDGFRSSAGWRSGGGGGGVS